MVKRKNQARILAVTAILSTTFPAPAAEADPDYPFANRIIFSQTPETGDAWHGGIRMKDVLCWDFYWNAADWFTVDFLHYGISLNIPEGDTIHLADKFNLFAIKSRPFRCDLSGHPYKISAGIEVYATVFDLFSSAPGSDTLNIGYRQGGLFVVQSWYVKNFFGSHYFNLLVSFASHKFLASWYIIPGYRYFFDHPGRLSFDIEYYYMNPYELPVKILQIAADPDQMPFENPNLNFCSWVFWGFSYSFTHLRLEAHIGHYPSVIWPFVPVLGVGWDF